MILDLGTASFGNGYLFTQLKQNDPLIKHFVSIYIDFYEYPHYSGRISETFETNFNENIRCDFGYAYYSRKQKMCKWVNE